MITATKEEYDSFIMNYPNKLERSVLTFCEPPVVQFNDFSNDKIWPESVVAQYQELYGTNYKPNGKIVYKIKE